MKKKKPEHISQEDWDAMDIPELTDEDFKRMRPAREVLPVVDKEYQGERKARVHRPNRGAKMTWNYRVLRHNYKGEVFLQIHEVYYDEKGEIEAVTEEPVGPGGETIEELKGDLSRMLEALKKPILDYDKIDSKITKR